MQRELRSFVLYGLLFGSTCGCELFVEDYKADLVVSRGTQTARLCEVERTAYAFELDLASSNAQPDLPTYYAAQNQELLAHLSQITGMREGKSGVTYLEGAPGIGKSFILRSVFDALDDKAQCSVELTDLFTEDAAKLGFPVANAADLATIDGSIVLSTLPAMTEPAGFDFQRLLDAASCFVDGKLVPIVVIDGIDELQEESSKAILAAVDEYVLRGSGAQTFVHFVVGGRPEGFASWLTDPKRTEQNQKILQRFVLNAPHYKTSGDLAFRVRTYLDFTGELEKQEQSGTLQATIDKFTSAVAIHPFLTYSIGNLSVGNVVVEQTTVGPTKNEEELKAALFDDILLRNAETHGRPGKDSAYDGPYRRALEDIAVRYVDVDARGEFAVRAEDTVSIVDNLGQSLGEVRVRNVLNRAGVAFLSSATTVTTRYHFEPFWLHAHLIERHNQRLDPTHQYQGCE